MKRKNFVCAAAMERAREDIAEKRWASRMLVDMLVDEERYNSAAEIVSGFGDRFRKSSSRIESSYSSEQELEALCDAARAETAYMMKWSKDILTRLSTVPETTLLRAAIRYAETSALTLAREVESATARLEEAREHAVE